MAFVLQPYNIKWQRTIFGIMSHDVQQLPVPVVPQELNSTPDVSARRRLRCKAPMYCPPHILQVEKDNAWIRFSKRRCERTVFCLC